MRKRTAQGPRRFAPASLSDAIDATTPRHRRDRFGHSQDFDGLSMPELDAANVESERVFFAHALVPCEHCGRRFRRDALRKHRVSCTASRPFAKPLARQTERVKVSNWR